MNYALVKDALKKKRMTYRDLALAIGVPFNTVAAWFQRKTKKIPIENIVKIANALDMHWWDVQPQSKYSDIKTYQDAMNDYESGEFARVFGSLDECGKSLALKLVETISIYRIERKDKADKAQCQMCKHMEPLIRCAVRQTPWEPGRMRMLCGYCIDLLRDMGEYVTEEKEEDGG